ncbi:MAG: bifunctional serine/threonine-protein kinase/formylglycine-generating enzyme family protein [Planctomycetota bacterium]|jgi:formylglycine-generating enzyme required for sulfatase activity
MPGGRPHQLRGRFATDDAGGRNDEEAPPNGGGDEGSLLDSAIFCASLTADTVAASAGGEPRLEAGDAIAGRRIVRELGRGGQAIVYLAQDVRLGRPVAIKVLCAAFPADPMFVERFKWEARAAARLNHPAICAVHDAGVEEGFPFIVMRYVEGQSLAGRIAEAKESSAEMPGPMRAVDLVERVARAVHAAHEAGIVHRDLKPGNIMITPGGAPVVLDFGLARDERSAAALTLDGRVFGTPAYMAPEQIDPECGQADRRTDVFALGATLYECLTLRRPFDEPTRESLYRAILAERPRDPRRDNPSVPRDLKAVLETALAKEQDRRYQTALDLAEDLRRVRLHLPIRARTAGPLRRLVHWAQRNRALAAILATILLALAVGLALTGTLVRQTSGALAESRRLTDMRTLGHLERTASDQLWPVLPETVPTMDRWLNEAEVFHGRLGLHRSYLQSLRRGAGGWQGHDTWTFDDPDLQREHDLVAGFVNDLSRFPETIELVRARRADAATIARRTIVAFQHAWRETSEAVADERRSPMYNGLHLEPQVGLVPVGRDPESGFFEFAHLQTGAVPDRHPQTGRLVLTELTGLVFVLIPGGQSRMGAEPPGEGKPLGSPNVIRYLTPDADCLPVHDVELDAFFISKYEMTQGQWLRVTGRNPSRWSPGSDAHGEITLLHPVESVSWIDSVEVLGRFGLVLPTEAQWEYAARAGTSTVWWTGNDQESLRAAVNLADQSAARVGADWPHIAEWPDLDDGYVEHAPVGTYRPNPFGLHDVHGNVWEYVRDNYGSYELPVRAGDGRRLAEDSGKRVQRGGGFYESVFDAMSARRYDVTPSNWTFSSGLRPARALSSGDTAAGSPPS